MDKEKLYEMQNQDFDFECLRVSYPHLDERETYQGQTNKFSVMLMVHKQDNEDDMNVLRDMIAHATDIAEYATDGEEFDPWSQCTLKDGDEEKDENQHGYMLFKATSDDFPELYDAAGDIVKHENAKDKRWITKGGHHVHATIRCWYAAKSKRVVFDIGFLQHNKEAGGEEFGAPKPDYSSKVRKGGRRRPSAEASGNTEQSEGSDGGSTKKPRPF